MMVAGDYGQQLARCPFAQAIVAGSSSSNGWARSTNPIAWASWASEKQPGQQQIHGRAYADEPGQQPAEAVLGGRATVRARVRGSSRVTWRPVNTREISFRCHPCPGGSLVIRSSGPGASHSVGDA